MAAGLKLVGLVLVCIALAACGQSDSNKPKELADASMPKPVAGFDTSKLTPCQRTNSCTSALQIRDELKAMAETAGSESVQKQTGPECAQFNPDHTPKVKGGCTREQMEEWHKTH